VLEKGKRAKLEILQCIPWKKDSRETSITCPGGQQLSVRRAPVSSTSSLLVESDTDKGLLACLAGRQSF